MTKALTKTLAITPEPDMPMRALTDSSELAAGSPAWLALRRQYMTGSDAGPACEQSPYRTAFMVYLDKRGELPAQPDNPAMLWGRRLEPVVRQHYVDTTGAEVFVPKTMFVSTRYPWMAANLDGLRPDRVYEGKTARSREGWGEPHTDEVPLYILLQAQHYMVVVDKPLTDIAVLFGGSDFEVFHVPADRELQAMVIDAEHDLYQRVLRGDPPPVRELEDVRRRYGALGVRGSIPADETDIAAWQTLHEAQQQQRDLATVEAECKAQLMLKLGEHGDTLTDREGKPLVTWKLAKAPNRFDMDAFANEHPDLFTQYSKPGTPSRRFLLKA